MLSGRRTTLTAQLIQRTVLLSAIAIVALVFAIVGSAAAALISAQRAVNDEGAYAAREFDLFLRTIEADLTVVAASFFAPDDVEAGFRSALARHDEIFDLRLVEPDGDIVAQRRRGAVMGAETVQDQPWLAAVQRGETYIGTVDFAEFGVPFVSLALPALDQSGTFFGTLIARLDLTALWQRVIAIEVGETGYAYIADADGQLLVYADLERVRQGTNTAEAFGLRPDEINDANPLGVGVMNSYTGLRDERVIGSSVALRTANWYAVVEQPLEEAVAPFVPLFVALAAGLVISVLLVLTTVFFIRRRVASPLRDIISGAQSLAAGNLGHRITPRGAHELQDLSNTLNQMSTELQEVNRTLEARVRARTRDLQLAAQLSEQISTILNPDVLLPQVVDLTRDSFDLYHAHIYLLDDTGSTLVLRAGAGEIGRTMIARGHSIPANAELSLVARAARRKAPVIVADTSADPGFLPNPLLPGTRSEAALPLLAGERVLGVLDVQSEQPGRFDRDLITVLSTMAGQIAVAIDNASLFSSVERASRQEQALSLVTHAIQNATTMDEVLQVAARELGRALRVPETAIELRVE